MIKSDNKKELSFDDLPSAVTEIMRLLNILMVRSEKQEGSEEERWFDLEELINYLPQKPAKPTVYAWVASQSIPFHKRGIGGKKLYFLKSEIDEFLRNGGTRGAVTNKQAKKSRRNPVNVRQNPGNHENI